MPFEYVRDDAKHRIKVTVSDPLTVAELIASVEHQLADGTWQHTLIVDARRLILLTPNVSFMQSFVSYVAELVAAHGPRGPIAIVSTQSGVISSGQMYNLFGGEMEPVEVFWDIDEGQQWLDQRSAQDR